MVKEIKASVKSTAKKLFVTDQLFLNNEVQANKLVSLIMVICGLMLVVAYMLDYFGVFHLNNQNFHIIVIAGMVELFVPAMISVVKRGESRWLKYLVMIEFTIVLARINAALPWQSVLMMVLPVVLSVRYYDRMFVVFNACFSGVMFFLARLAATLLEFSKIDLNYITIQPGTILKIETDIRDAINAIGGVDKMQYFKRYLIESYMPAYLISLIIIVVCAEIARKGKIMVLEQHEMAVQHAAVETELNLATTIQAGMLPQIFPAFPDHLEVDLYATMDPAKEVGGDFYDYFRVDDDHVGVCIADVSGKGVPAALFMVIAKTLIRNQTQNGTQPGDVLTMVNRQLCEGNEADLFVTCWLGVLNVKTNKLVYSNAGHNPPLVKTDSMFRYLRDRHGLVLAALDDTQYGQSEIQLKKDDVLFLYTDGVTEASDFDNELYGEERLLSFLNMHRNDSVKDMLLNAKANIDAFAGDAPQFDDITMLVMRLTEDNHSKE